MREIKCRYIYKQIATGAIRTVEATLEQIEESTDPAGPFSNVTHWIDEGYEIVDNVQYTGLRDKNGKEIYEGDIVKGKRYVAHLRDHARFIGEVDYTAPAFRLNGVGQYKGIIHEELHGAYQVIGNIYEHPHLLEKEEKK